MAESYSTKERAAIETRVINGLSQGIPLAQLCREEGMPDRVTVWRWSEEDDDFAQRIARARVAGFDVIAEECLEIADDATNDYVERKRGEDQPGEMTFDAEHVQRSRLRIDTRLKLLAKWDPKRYGELMKHAGPDGSEPIRAAVTVTFRKTDAADAG